MKKIFFILPTFVCLIGYSQHKLEDLQVGDTVPDVAIKTFLNYSAPQAKLSDFRGRLLILDFWGPYCLSCIAGMPDMEAIQQEFGEKVTVLLVTKNQREDVDRLIQRSRIVRTTKLPIVFGDSSLSRLFVYTSVPTHVWIDPSGRVIQKTAGENTTMIQVRKWMEGAAVALPAKIDFADYQMGKPLFLEGGGRQLDHLKYYSLLMGRTSGLDGLSDIALDVDSITGKAIRVLASNTTVLDLYRLAYSETDTLNNFIYQSNRIILEGINPSDVTFPPDRTLVSDWAVDHLYSYEIKVPPEKASFLFSMMRDDLYKYFNYTAAIKRRKVKCLVLHVKDATKLATRGGVPQWISWDDGQKIQIRNKPFALFVSALIEANQFVPTPLINETKYTGSIDITLQAGLNDVAALRRELRTYGLELTEEERTIEMFVMRKK